MREPEIENIIRDKISLTPVGEKVHIRFRGLSIPVETRMRFRGGWEIMYTLIPGMPLEFIRGEDAYIDEVNIILNPHVDLH